MYKVSIILPSYNHAKFLNDRLNSIINQTYTNWKLIIIDDCSTDLSVKILKEFKEKNTDKIEAFIINANNSGSGYKSWKKGIQLAKGEYIWIAETDDYSDFYFLENLVNLLDKNKDASLAFCASIYVDAKKEEKYTSEKRTKVLDVELNENKIFNEKVLINRMPFNTLITNGSSVVFRKPKHNLPEELFEYKQSSDIFLWTYLVKNKSFIFLNKKLNYFRRHEDSTTTKMNVSSKKNIYKEKIKYLNYFNQPKKFQILLNHYIKHYLWNNKKQLFNYGFLKETNKIKYMDVKYYYSLLKFIFNKIRNEY